MSDDVVVVQIPFTTYEELMESAAFLEALQACGVDDWEGYEEAVEYFNNMDKEYVQ